MNKDPVMVCCYILVVAIFMFLVARCAQADDLTPKEKVKEGVFISMLVVDGVMTHQWLKSDPGHYELNPILGKHPSDKALVLGCVIGSSLHVLAVELLPESLRSPFQDISLSFEGLNLVRNVTIGMKFSF